MSDRENQGLWAPRWSTVRFPRSLCLAQADRERLWNGLERFVNCEDSNDAYRALSLAFADFWPAEIAHYQTTDEGECASLNWYQAGQKFFLFYRDTLKEIWRGENSHFCFTESREDFLMGLSSLNHDAQQAALEPYSGNLSVPHGLLEAWREILDTFPTAAVVCEIKLKMHWTTGDFRVVPDNDFQRAFYLLFRQSWRARICPTCSMYFVARKPKQLFCGTSCSAGSRLASKRRWWQKVGKNVRSGKPKAGKKRSNENRTGKVANR
jgi:hypothetical protein